MRRRRSTYLLAVCVALVTFTVFLPGLRNDFVIWDDEQVVRDNLHIRTLDRGFFRWALTDLSFSLWQPLTWLSHAVDYAVWGLNPMGHHLTSILLHAVNAFLVVCAASILLETAAGMKGPPTASVPDSRETLIAAGVTGLLFGLHPQHVETAVWITGRTDLLCALFFLLSIMAYLKHVCTRNDRDFRGGSRVFVLGRWYALAFVWFFLALAAKPFAVILPAVFLLLDWYPLRRLAPGGDVRSALAEKAPFLAAAAAVSLVTVSAHATHGFMVTTGELPLATRILLAGRAFFEYLRKAVVPVDLLPFYPYPDAASVWSMHTYVILAFVVCLTILCISAAKRYPVFMAAWGYFVLAMLPSLAGMGGRRSFMADRYAYLADAGFFLVLGIAAAQTWSAPAAGEQRRIAIRTIAAAVTVSVITVMAVLTVRQIAIWKDSIGLWSRVIAKHPEISEAYNNRGLAYKELGQPEQAIGDYTEAIRIRPDAKPYTNRGIVFAERGDLDLALADFDAAIALKADYADAYTSRGLLFVNRGEAARGLADLDTAIRLKPDSIDAYLNLGVAHEQMNELGKAVESYGAVLRLDPKDYLAYNNRGNVLFKMGRFSEAVGDLSQAIALSPAFGKAYLLRGECYLKLGNAALAAQDYQTACGLGEALGCEAVKAQHAR